MSVEETVLSGGEIEEEGKQRSTVPLASGIHAGRTGSDHSSYNEHRVSVERVLRTVHTVERGH